MVVVIDAADNSITAAETQGERSFVQSLVSCGIPDGCRLVFTSRTQRREQLGLPSSAIDIPLEPFTDSESRQNLSRRFDAFSDADADDFHRLTKGIPRVQGYALERANDGLNAVLGLLRPDGKNLESILDSWFDEAARRSGSAETVAGICGAIATLPRPVPIEFIAELAGVTVSGVEDVVTDLGRGLMVSDGAVHFRDEDFENHLKVRHPAEKLRSQVADLLMARRQTSSYAASSVAEALHLAGRTTDLIGLIYSDRQPSAISDPIERKEAFARRARLALNAANVEQNREHVMRLLIVVGQATKADHALEALL
ncbi:MAG: hypothetical protein ACREHD_20645, partial [Pirellulales bacterium]